MANLESTQTTTGAHLRPVTISELPDGARALLVSVDSETGQFTARPIVMGESILNINRDLLNHLNVYPHTSEWLEVLRDYCDGRLKAQEEAKERGSFVMPGAHMDWDMASILSARGATQ